MITQAPPGIDMSPEAIDRRLRRLSGLYQLTTSFKNVKWLGRTEGLEAQRSGQKTKDPGQHR